MVKENDRLKDLLEEDEEEEEIQTANLIEEELETVPFDLEKLLLEGKDAILTREIEFFDTDDGKKKKMEVYIKPLSRGERGQIDRAVAKKNTTKNIVELICAFCWCMDKKGAPMDLSIIREMPDGVAKSVSEEIKFISGDFKDRFEDKAIDKIFGKD